MATKQLSKHIDFLRQTVSEARADDSTRSNIAMFAKEVTGLIDKMLGAGKNLDRKLKTATDSAKVAAKSGDRNMQDMAKALQRMSDANEEWLDSFVAVVEALNDLE